MAEKHVDQRHEAAVDLDRALASALLFPQRRTVVAVEADEDAVLPGSLHGLADDGRGAGRERRHDASGVEPADALGGKEGVPVDLAGMELGDGGVAAIHHAHGSADAGAALEEVDAVAGGAADAVVGEPTQMREVDAALEHEVFEQAADGVVGERRDDGGAQAEAAPEAAGDVVLAASFPDAEVTGVRDALLAGVEAQHDLAERDEVPARVFDRADGQPGRARCAHCANSWGVRYRIQLPCPSLWMSSLWYCEGSA